MLQRLNLVPPDVEPASSHRSNPPVLPPPDPQRLKDVQRRAELILKSGQIPECVFVCSVPTGILMFQPGPGKTPVMMLFMTYLAAKDYIQAAKATSAAIKQINIAALPEIADAWIAAGVETVVLNRCARCNLMSTFAIKTLKERDPFLKVWAITRAIQLQRGEMKVREFMEFQGKDRPRARAALENIRDHIGCDVPYLFELLAFLARGDQDEAAKHEALQRLNDFGPQFADWDARWENSSSTSPMTKSLAVATLGLAQNFGIIFKAPAPPSDPMAPASKGPDAPERFPGNYYFFRLLIEISINGVTDLGYPKQAITDVGAKPPVIRWASPLEVCWPDPAIPRAPWIDDPNHGLSGRTIKCASDLLGAEGIIGRTRYRFEQILQETKEQVTFALIDDEKQTRIAYAFARKLFQAKA
jgi:hypothetical protein